MVQSVQLAFVSGIIYGAPEPVEPSLDYRVQQRSPDDRSRFYARTDGHTVASLVPAVSEEQLAAAVADAAAGRCGFPGRSNPALPDHGADVRRWPPS
ncbi:MAG: hypothetical protein R3A10_22105 [Caldilineaceae bacterium]